MCGFWLDGFWFDVFGMCYYWFGILFGLVLCGSFVYIGDIWLILEMFVMYVVGDVCVVYDCGLVGNFLYIGIDDIECEYDDVLCVWLVLYYYGSVVDGEVLEFCGYIVVWGGDCFVFVILLVVCVDVG